MEHAQWLGEKENIPNWCSKSGRTKT